MFEMSFVVALGMTVLFYRLGVRGRLWINSHPIFCDIAAFVILYLVHGGGGTFSGGMVAAFGAFFCSLFISLTRKWFGYIQDGVYHRGWVDVGGQL